MKKWKGKKWERETETWEKKVCWNFIVDRTFTSNFCKKAKKFTTFQAKYLICVGGIAEIYKIFHRKIFEVRLTKRKNTPNLWTFHYFFEFPSSNVVLKFQKCFSCLSSPLENFSINFHLVKFLSLEIKISSQLKLNQCEVLVKKKRLISEIISSAFVEALQGCKKVNRINLISQNNFSHFLFRQNTFLFFYLSQSLSGERFLVCLL